MISGDIFATVGGIIEVVTVELPSGYVFVVSITVVPSASTRCVVVSIVAIAGAAVAVGISSCTGVGEVVTDATNGGGGEFVCFGSGILKHVMAIIHQRINDMIDVIPPDFKLHPYVQTFDARIRMVKSWNNPMMKKKLPMILHPDLGAATHDATLQTTTIMVKPISQANIPRALAALSIESRARDDDGVDEL